MNRFKSDKDDVDATRLKGYSCDVKFSGMQCLTIFAFTCKFIFGLKGLVHKFCYALYTSAIRVMKFT